MSASAVLVGADATKFSERLSRWLPLLLFLLSVEERVAAAPYTGAHNSVVLVALCAFLVCLIVLRGRVRLFKLADVAIMLAVTAWVVGTTVGRGDLREAARYLLTFFAAFGWTVLLRGAIRMTGFRRDLLRIFRALVILGGILSVPALLDQSARASGFLVSSPTLFSFVLLIALCVFLWGGRSRWDLALGALAAVLILDTGTRTSIVTMGFLLVWRMLGRFQSVRRDAALSLAGVRVALLAAFLLAPIVIVGWYGTDTGVIAVDAFDQLSRRSAAADSTATRLGFYGTIIRDFGPMTAFVGNGAGHAFRTLTEATGARIPPHFDLLALAADFGIGLVLILLLATTAAIRRYGLTSGPVAVLLVFFLSGQFHNAMYSPLAVLLSVTAFIFLADSPAREHP